MNKKPVAPFTRIYLQAKPPQALGISTLARLQTVHEKGVPPEDLGLCKGAGCVDLTGKLGGSRERK